MLLSRRSGLLTVPAVSALKEITGSIKILDWRI
jgi:hypothetical protein